MTRKPREPKRVLAKKILATALSYAEEQRDVEIIQPSEESFEELAEALEWNAEESFKTPDGQNQYFGVLARNLRAAILLLGHCGIPDRSLRHLNYLERQLEAAAEGRRPELLKQPFKRGAPSSGEKVQQLRTKIAACLRFKRDVQQQSSPEAAKEIFNAIGKGRMKAIMSTSGRRTSGSRPSRPFQVIEKWLDQIDNAKTDDEENFTVLAHTALFAGLMREIGHLSPETQSREINEQIEHICWEIDQLSEPQLED